MMGLPSCGIVARGPGCFCFSTSTPSSPEHVLDRGPAPFPAFGSLHGLCQPMNFHECEITLHQLDPERMGRACMACMILYRLTLVRSCHADFRTGTSAPLAQGGGGNAAFGRPGGAALSDQDEDPAAWVWFWALGGARSDTGSSTCARANRISFSP